MLPVGRTAQVFTLEGKGGLKAEVTNFGAAVVSMWAPDAHGELADVVLGYDSLAGYVAGKAYFGATVGRYANRIAGGRFSLEEREYRLACNNGPNHLHGGREGFHQKLWEAEVAASAEGPSVVLTRTSPDGEEGYPGNLRVRVTYTLREQGLRITYAAETDAPTPINLTNHAFFNLSGVPGSTILDHEVMLAADFFTPTNAALIPTGELRPVAGTALDFREPRRVGERIAEDEQLRLAGGYDQNFVVRGGGGKLALAAQVREPGCGRTLEVWTTEPGVQFYTGNFLDGTEIGKGGVPCEWRTGLCLETQHFPDGPNQPGFPGTVLQPGEAWESVTEWRVA